MSTFAAGTGFEDPYSFSEPEGVAGWRLVADRVERSPYLVAGQSTCVMISKGQSNFTTLGFSPTYTIVNSLNENFNVYNGGLYVSSHPLVGCTGNNGFNGNNNLPARVADLLISNGKYQRVIHVPLAISGTRASEWAPGGDCSMKTTVAIRRLTAVGLTPTLIIDMQGETDNAAGTSAATYKALKQAEVQVIRDLGCTAPWLVGICSYNGGTVSDEVRTGQFQSADVGLNILHGADTDFLTSPTYRLDGTHLGAVGNTAAANLWYNAIVDGLGL